MASGGRGGQGVKGSGGQGVQGHRACRTFPRPSRGPIIATQKHRRSSSIQRRVTMRTRGLMRPFFLLGVLAALTLVLLAACGDDEEKTAATKSPAATVAPTVAKINLTSVPELPDGKLLVGSDISYPP